MSVLPSFIEAHATATTSRLISGLVVLDGFALEAAYGHEGLNEIAKRIHLLAPPLTPAEASKQPELLAKTEVIFSSWNAPVMDGRFLAAAPRLRAVFYAAGSIRYFTTPAFWERDIMVSSAYAINGLAVAEFTLGAILLSVKHVWHTALCARRDGAMHHRDTTHVPGAYGSVIGLVSLGAIARQLLVKLRSFDFRVVVYDPYVTSAEAAALGVRLVSLEEVFALSDVVSVHTPLLTETKGMIGREHFARMRRGATFINTARGQIIRESELIDTFAARPDLQAVLDVTEPEPPVSGSPLYTLPNVVLTHHMAGAVNRECRRMGREMVAEFDRWRANEPLRWRITRDQAEKLA